MKGKVTGPETYTHQVSRNKLFVKQLTNGRGDSHHLYFTNPGWYENRLLFVSTRRGSTDLFSLDFKGGTITQLTYEQRTSRDLQFTSLNPSRPEAYFWRNKDLIALDLDTLKERTLYRTPDGYSYNMTSVTADGAQVCTVHYEDLSHRFKVDLLNGYVGFEQYWAAKPHSFIVLIDTATGSDRTVFSESAWIGHVNASPTLPHALTFCHEGPWEKVDNRIWGLDTRDGTHWKIREQSHGEAIGHEYWLANGTALGYQGKHPSGQSFNGTVDWTGSRVRDIAIDTQCKHVHSNDPSFIIGDGSKALPFLFYWTIERDHDAQQIPILCHGCSSKTQARHVHPRLSPDSQKVIFVSDQGGVANIFELSVEEVYRKCVARN